MMLSAVGMGAKLGQLYVRRAVQEESFLCILDRQGGLCRLSRMNAGKTPRLTHQSLRILQIFLESPSDKLSGAEIRRRTAIFSGTLYPILVRFEEAGLLQSEWEEGDPKQLGRPRRRLYQITGHGVSVANEAFRELIPTIGKLALP